jgi:hypothetical protein
MSSGSGDVGTAGGGDPGVTMRGRRRTLVWALIVLASLIAITSALTTWVHRQMLDEQSWRNASARLIEDPEVRSAVSVYVVDQLYDNVDVAAALSERLPTDLKGLADPVATALRQPATDAVERLLEGPRVQQLFIDASSEAQQKLVNVLEDKTGRGITTGDGVVTLDLSQLARELAADLGFSQSAIDRIPPDTGKVTVMRSDQLAEAQAAVQGVRVLSTALLVLVLVLYALAVYLAHGERRPTLRNVGWALMVVGLVLLVTRRLAGRYVIDALTNPSSESAGHDAWLIGSSILAEIGWAAFIYGAVVVVGSVFAGPTKPATSVRRSVAPVLNEQSGIAWASAGGVFLLLILWGPTHALRVVWGIALLGALLAAGIVAVRRQTLREFPGHSAPPDIRQAAPEAHGEGGNGQSTAAAATPRSPSTED